MYVYKNTTTKTYTYNTYIYTLKHKKTIAENWPKTHQVLFLGLKKLHNSMMFGHEQWWLGHQKHDLPFFCGKNCGEKNHRLIGDSLFSVKPMCELTRYAKTMHIVSLLEIIRVFLVNI
jgi:hypothetical protein